MSSFLGCFLAKWFQMSGIKSVTGWRICPEMGSRADLDDDGQFVRGRHASPFGGNCLRPLCPLGGQVFEQEAQLDGVLVIEVGVGGEGGVAGAGEDGLEGGDESLQAVWGVGTFG